MKKIIRLIITIVFFPVWFPVSAFAFSIFGLVPMLGLTVFIGDGFLYLLGDRENKDIYLDNLKEGGLMAVSFIFFPIACGKDFIIKGHFRDLRL